MQHATDRDKSDGRPVKLRLKPNETREAFGVRITLVEPVPGHGRKREIVVEPIKAVRSE